MIMLPNTQAALHKTFRHAVHAVFHRTMVWLAIKFY